MVDDPGPLRHSDSAQRSPAQSGVEEVRSDLASVNSLLPDVSAAPLVLMRCDEQTPPDVTVTTLSVSKPRFLLRMCQNVFRVVLKYIN